MSVETKPGRIKVLLLEDNPRDAEMNLRELRRAGFDPEWVLVETEEQFVAALGQRPDLIISDFALPQFDGLRAVDVVRGRGLDIPFILVSGTLGEEAAVSAMRKGVDDYLLKASLVRLGASVAGALEKKRLRDEQKNNEDDKRRTEERLRLANEMQVNILNALPAHIAVLDSHGVIVTVNDAWRRFASANVLQGADFCVGQNYLGTCDRAHGECADEAQAVATGIRQVLSGEEKYFAIEYPCHSPAEKRWYRLMVTPLSETPGTGVVVMHVNITERRLAEDILSQKEREQRRLAEELTIETRRLHESQAVANIGSWETDLATFEVTWTNETFRIFGTSPEKFKVTHQGFLERVHPEDRQSVDDAFRRSIGEQGPFAIEHRLLFPDRRIRFVEERWHTFNDAAGRPMRAIGTCQDITARKQAEERIVEQAALLDKANDSIIVRDLEHRVMYWNHGAESIFGWSQDEVMGNSIRELFFADPSPYDEAVRAVLQDGEWTGELEKRTKANQAVILDSRWTLLRDGAGQPTSILTIETNITERKRMERQLLRRQRLESIGTLAGGLAHDLNNALAPIMMGVELLRQENPGESEITDLIATSARHGADMVRQLLTFAKGAEGERVPLQPDRLVTELDKLMHGSFPKNIQLLVKRAPNLPTVEGDATQLHQVLLNLCVNARDAMPHGGTLTLEAQGVEVDAVYASGIPSAKPGQHLMFRVRDTGTGMPPEVLDRIFDPFYSTKGPDKGTGLGLSTVMGIVKGHGGFLHVYSEPGHGSTFAVYLPTTDRASSDTERVTKAAAAFLGHGETILLVDDEVAVREMARAVLRRLNFNPLTATDGVDGMIQAAEHRADLRAIVTDVHMPHMDGLAFVRASRRLLPDIPVIVASGHLEAELAEQLKALGGVSWLDKPFTELQLAEALKKVLVPK